MSMTGEQKFALNKVLGAEATRERMLQDLTVAAAMGTMQPGSGEVVIKQIQEFVARYSGSAIKLPSSLKIQASKYNVGLRLGKKFGAKGAALLQTIKRLWDTMLRARGSTPATASKAGTRKDSQLFEIMLRVARWAMRRGVIPSQKEIVAIAIW